MSFIDIKGNTVSMDAHKCILAANSLYFEKLFTLLSEQDKKEIIIKDVPDAQGVYDIVMTFYGRIPNYNKLPQWKYKFIDHKCSNFLMINHKISFEYMTIPNKDFEDFLDEIDQCEYTEETVKCILQNLPDDYDTSKLPDDLKNAMIEFAPMEIVTVDSNHKIIKWRENIYKHVGNFMTRTHEIESVEHIIQMSYDRSMFATIDATNNINVWNVSDNKVFAVLRGNTLKPYGIFFTRDNKSIVGIDENNTIFIWNIATGELLNSFKLPIENRICWIESSFDQKLIAFNRTDGSTMTIFNLETGTIVKICANDSAIKSIYFSSDNLRILTGDDNGRAKIWDIATGSIISNFFCHGMPLNASYSHNNEFIITSDLDGNIKLWDTVIGILLHTLSGHKYNQQICYNCSPDNKYIVSADGYNIIRVWKVSNGKLLHSFEYSAKIKAIGINIPLINKLKTDSK